MSLDPKVPPAGEDIHLPGLSAQPLLVALFTTTLLLGVTFHWVVWSLSAIFLAWTIISWVRASERDIAELPVHAEHH